MRVALIIIFYLANMLADTSGIYLTPQERKWLLHHKDNLKVGITKIPNQVLLDQEGKPHGFSMDIFAIIEKTLGIKFRYIRYKNWRDLITAAKKRDIDIVFLARKTEHRLNFLDFTDTVIAQQNKIIVNSKNSQINKEEDIIGKKVAIVAKSAIYEYLKTKYPQTLLIPTNSELESLKILSKNRVDATIMEPVRAAYYINRYNINNILIASKFGYKYNLRIASRNDIKILNILLNKAIESISQKKMKELYLKWGYIKYEVNFFDKQTLIYISIIFGIIIPLLIYLYIINRRLKEEIKKNILAQYKLDKLNKELENRIKKEVEKNKKQQLLLFQQNRLAQMGEMISMIAHQWRQPLNNLSLAIHTLMLKYSKNKLDNKYIQYFHTQSTKHISYMSQTIDDFRNFFKNEESQCEFKLIHTIKESLKLIEQSFANENIKISISGDTDIKLNNYPNTIMQAIINILNNAKDILIERNIPNKEIYIKAKKVKDNIIIEIEDNAGGIDASIIDKVFDPYFTTKNKKDGTGLGLYMSKMIIEQKAKGSIKVENSSIGAKFTITI